MATPIDGQPPAGTIPTPADIAAQQAQKQAQQQPAGGPPEGDTFPRSYVEDLRAENKARRQAEAEKDARLAELQAWKEEQELALLTEEEQRAVEYQNAVSRGDEAEARAAEYQLQYEVALRAGTLGIHDPSDAVRLLDWNALQFDESGDVTNMDDVLKDLIKAKPYLRGAVQAITVDTPVGGNPSNDRSGSAPLTIEQIKAMSPDEINARWGEIEPVLAAQKR